jgi:hypothetical protein
MSLKNGIAAKMLVVTLVAAPNCASIARQSLPSNRYPYSLTDFTQSDRNCLAQSGVTKLDQATLAQIQTAGTCSINLRVSTIDTAITDLQNAFVLAAEQRVSLEAIIGDVKYPLEDIQASLNSATTAGAALAIYYSIFQNVRMFELQIPRTIIWAHAFALADLLIPLERDEESLSARNARASAEVQAENQPLFTDFGVQGATVNSASVAAISAIDALVPDNGNSTILAANNAALESAYSFVTTTGRGALATAVTDLEQIRSNLDGE